MSGIIFHPTDFSADSHVAFVHALKVALVAKAQLHMMHVDPNSPVSDWDDFPQVRAALEQWGVLPAGSSRADVIRLGMGVEKILAYKEDPERELLRHVDAHRPDLMVLATHRHEGVYHWMGKSLAEPLARRARIPTLFIPAGHDGFVSVKDGSVRLQRLLIPIDHLPRPQSAVDAAVRLGRLFGTPELTAHVLHVGNADQMPSVATPPEAGWKWVRWSKDGNVLDAILQLERELLPDLVVMATAGRHGMLDVLQGSTTEQVLHHVHCPLLAVPA